MTGFEHDVSDFDEGGTVEAPRHERHERSAFALTVVDGPDAGRMLRVEPNQPSAALIGQSPACALRLSDPTVSRRHVALEFAEVWLRVTDLDSTNHTFIDDIPVVDAFLRGGEMLRVGATTLRVEVQRATAPQDLPELSEFGRVIGMSPEMRRLYPLLERLAASSVPVIIEGETGTGKEVLAESLHEQSPRAQGPFVVFDCTAVPPSLVESELFGNEKGAFTGAVAARKGVFEQAHGGTLLIDEIGDLDLNLQPKLLRAIERTEVRRLGGDRATRVDVRILAATRRDLDRAVQEGTFRDDLYHRLAVGRVALPPLRGRRGDVALLAGHFWEQLGGGAQPMPARLLRRWETSPWPGNVRQLRNAVARALALGDLGAAENADIDEAASSSLMPPPKPEAPGDVIAQVIGERLSLPVGRLRVVAEFERRYIEHVLAEHGGNVARAAEASGIARRYFEILRAGKRR